MKEDDIHNFPTFLNNLNQVQGLERERKGKRKGRKWKVKGKGKGKEREMKGK